VRCKPKAATVDSRAAQMKESCANPTEEACVSPKAIAVAGLSALAVAAGGCSGGSDAEPESPPANFANLTTTFVSPTHGFSFRYGRGRPIPATKLWNPVIEPPVDTRGTYDGPFDIWETGSAAFFKSASTEIPEGVSIDEWVDKYVTPGGCGATRSRQAEITIDGQPGRISECPKATEAAVNRIEATVVAGGRLYLFILLSDRPDYREVFDYFASTIDLRPETAAEAEFSAAFKKDFSTAPWIHHITGVKMSSEYPTSLVVTTDLHKASDTLTGAICHAGFQFADDHEVGDGIEAVVVLGADGEEGGCA
jgi:hypothetical protein